MKDENFCTIGGRITHDPTIYATPQQGQLLCFSIAHHTNYPKPNSVAFYEIKVSGNSDPQKLQEFSTWLSKGRKVTIHNAELQFKSWTPKDSEEEKTSYHLFCRMDQVYLHDLPKRTTATE